MLLLAQQGALLHELSHYSAPQSQGQKQSSLGEACELCLAFAQVDSAAAPDVSIRPLLAGLSFHAAPAPAAYVGGIWLPAERNRGPPPVL
ncbi:MAG: hypothetical protein HY021_01385 [Burkholderiales bacterium]|nr:hypothetical protein [Burkholderiales bacterium]